MKMITLNDLVRHAVKLGLTSHARFLLSQE